LRETNARGSVHILRIKDAYPEIGECDAISARALADLDGLLGYSAPWMLGKENCRGFFHKGRDYLREIDKARGRWEFDLLEHKSAVEQESVILEVSNLRRLV
jgi:16S rRNA (guanine527-N7)-methyltransferase